MSKRARVMMVREEIRFSIETEMHQLYKSGDIVDIDELKEVTAKMSMIWERQSNQIIITTKKNVIHLMAMEIEDD